MLSAAVRSPDLTRINEVSDRAANHARIVLLLHACERAGLSPISLIPFHAFAFLANVLAPVWDMLPLNGKILKRRGGPFYPELQQDLDLLVGRGVVTIRGVHHVRDDDGRWRLEGKYRLHHPLASEALEFLLSIPDERRFAEFATELAYALSSLRDQELAQALVEDATYAAPSTSENNVVDFSEWEQRNPSVDAANLFDELVPPGTHVTPGEKLHLYVHHLHRRLSVG